MTAAEKSVAVTRNELKKSFHIWGKGMPRFADIYAKVRNFSLVEDAIAEMTDLQPSEFDRWYLINHHRYLKMTQIERNRVRILGKNFFEDLHHGRLEFGQAMPRGKHRKDNALRMS